MIHFEQLKEYIIANTRSHKLLIFFYFSIIFIIGLSIYKDYGISWDEGTSRKNGIHSYNYIFKGDRTLSSYKDRDYGVAFELPLIIIEKFLKLNDTQEIYQIRHLCTFSLFFLGLIVFYLMGKHYFNDWKMGLLGSLMLFLSPRILAHSFYNSKDIPFLSLYLISIFTLIKFLDTKNIRYSLLHAFVCSLLIDIRIVGLVIPSITFLFSFLEFARRKEKPNPTYIYNLCIYVLSLIGCTILFWPYLWHNSLDNFIQAFLNMSDFRLKSSILYLGHYINPAQLPWHYVPLWLLITTPILYVIHFSLGILTCFIPSSSGGRKLVISDEQRNFAILLMCFFLPLYAVIALKSVLYDSWRHMFFIYPPFLMISLNGVLFVFKLIKTIRNRTAFKIVNISYILIFFVQFTTTTYSMVKNHPHQNVYFNILTFNNLLISKKKFELDYWGLSYKQAIEHILDNDNSKKIAIFSPTPLVKINTEILSLSDRKRVLIVQDIKKAKYFIANYRWHFEGFFNTDEFEAVFLNLHNKKWYSLKLNKNNVFYSIEFDHTKIITVYKLDQSKIHLNLRTINRVEQQ